MVSVWANQLKVHLQMQNVEEDNSSPLTDNDH